MRTRLRQPTTSVPLCFAEWWVQRPWLKEIFDQNQMSVAPEVKRRACLRPTIRPFILSPATALQAAELPPHG